MASSQIMNGKQRDRIASYAMNNSNSYRSNTTANNNNATGTGNVAAGPSIQANQQQRRKKSYRARGCRGGASRKNSSRKKNLDSIDEENLNNNVIKHSANNNMSKSRSNKTRTLSILPKEEIKYLPPLRSDAADDSDKPILPSRDIRKNPTAPHRHRTRTRNVQSVIARPSANEKSNAVGQMGGFSFFSISPRSFLTGKKTSASFKS